MGDDGWKSFALPAMSEEQLSALLAKIKEDVGLQEKLKGAADLDAFLAIANEAGFDVIASRAFASLVDFTAWSRAALNPGGVWMAMKGKDPVDEIAALPEDVAVFHVEPLSVPGLDADRCIVWLKPLAR